MMYYVAWETITPWLNQMILWHLLIKSEKQKGNVPRLRIHSFSEWNGTAGPSEISAQFEARST